MATLHVLSHSPFTDSRLTSCLRVMGADDGILLCGDAVYALASSAPGGVLKTYALRLYVLDEDAKARNITAPEGVKSVDYPAFVDLSVQFDKVNTWL